MRLAPWVWRCVKSALSSGWSKPQNKPATRCVILDLAFPGLELPDLTQRLGELEAPPRVVAYGSHVDAASLNAARAAGCQPTLPRSKFVEDLPRDLPHWLAGPE